MKSDEQEHPVAVILSAGKSRKFGSNKLTADLSGRPLLWYVLDNIKRSGFDKMFLVVSNDTFEDLSKLFPDKEFLINPESWEGMSSSIRTAVSSLRIVGRPIFIMNGDQPFFNSDQIRKLVSLYNSNPEGIACASYRGEPRNPAIFPTTFFTDLMKLSGDDGGKSVISKNISHASLMELEDEMYLFDVDTNADMEIARKRFYDYLG